jgi:CAAX prenyl protease-like protein
MQTALPYILPFLVFVGMLATFPYLGLSPLLDQVARLVIVGGVIYVYSRHLLSWKIPFAGQSVLFGILVFIVWILPDLLIPGYRQHWLFTNSFTGGVSSSMPAAALLDPVVLALRTLRAAVLVPILEELFWRGWLGRWLVDQDFEKVPLGKYTTSAMLISGLLFASEHGPYWEVGLLAGLMYNYWLVKTRSLMDCIVAHGVTNLCLSLYVLATGKWEYWM